MSDIYDNVGRAFRRQQEQRTGTTAIQRPPDRTAGTAGEVVSDHSGLSLTLRHGVPPEPEQTVRRRVALGLKRGLIDLPLSLAALTVLSPLLIGVALAIRCSGPGRVLREQWRIGMNGRPFRMLQFRTQQDTGSSALDRMLGATGIEDLPQLLNIVAGDMAIVGPCPIASADGAIYRGTVPYYDYRHRVRPGLAGWAQANGLHDPVVAPNAAQQLIDHDCAYVQNFSLGLDVAIIARTVVRELRTGSSV